ncbi:sugar phosphate isomerase/epimerase [Microbacterium sp. C5A9]|uniref:sugar phosphate isomerase/epimerase family protein n=1 Tax=Microbacterium sp. C5A9 TaxID=2736663 RepID=UPI001F516427|nr:TIM barrel protein [Microbacterium sp. C5A9]MCI1020373.1 sugar phosphate isomerase/epimerase [Microbacterium sp. C5A9]
MTKIRPGLCSVTFRSLEAEEVIGLAAEAELDVIEWGADVHVPAGDIERAAQIATETADAGLTSCSYGSYFRAGAEESLTPILDSAEALGVDRVRIWAGHRGSAEASPEQWGEIVARLRDAAAEADARGIGLALEFHSGTLADTAPTTLRLLAEVDSPALSTYWQPTVGASVEAVLAEYRALAAHTSAAHVFSWWPAQERLPLRARDALWTRFFAEALGSSTGSGAPGARGAATGGVRDALLEFVPGDDPALLRGEAAALRAYLSA